MIRRMLPLVIAWFLGGIAAAQQGVYSTVEEALERMFPDADRVREELLDPNAEELAVCASRFRTHRSLGRDRFRVFVALRGAEEIGYAVQDDEIGKTQPISFLTEVRPDGSIGRIEVLVYREPVGGEIRSDRFLRQFRGKTLRDRIRRDDDIKRIHGSTLSTEATTIVARRALAVVETLYLTGGKVEVSRRTMGTTLTVIAFGIDRGALEPLLAAACDVAIEVERRISHFDPDSEISQLNRAAGTEPLAVSELTFAFLDQCRHHARLTRGAFDVTIGPAVRAWGFQGGEPRVPGATELERLATLVDANELVLERATRRAFLRRPGMALDPGGIGKGFGADRVAEHLRAHGVRRALVDLGGSLVAIGAPRGREGWPVVLRDPLDPTRFLGELTLRDAALSTTGTDQRFFERNGRRLGHVLDPRTCRPVEGDLRSVTVIAPNATWADAFSTGLFVLQTSEALALVERYPGLDCLRVHESRPGQVDLVVSRGVTPERFERFARGTPDTSTGEGDGPR